MYEGYGLTETTAPCAFNPLGVPIIRVPSAWLSLASSCVSPKMRRFRSRVPPCSRSTQERGSSEDSFTEDGWYRTGDLGRIDDDGFLYIIGRKKDLIITAGGKNVSPGPIEEVIKRCEFVSQALVLGDKRPFIPHLLRLTRNPCVRGWKARG